MCGRYVLTARVDLADALHERFGIVNDPRPLYERYNVAPSQGMPVIIEQAHHYDGDTRERLAEAMEWGLIAPWSKDPDSDKLRPINARSETVAEKKLFKGALAHHRCIVPAAGFYEWQKTEDGKQPWYFSGTDHELLGMAGIFTEWHGADGTIRLAYAILTREADDVVKPVHHRMPVMIPADEEGPWLDPELDVARVAAELIDSFSSVPLQAWPVDRSVGSPSNDHPDLIKPIEPHQETLV